MLNRSARNNLIKKFQLGTLSQESFCTQDKMKTSRALLKDPAIVLFFFLLSNTKVLAAILKLFDTCSSVENVPIRDIACYSGLKGCVHSVAINSTAASYYGAKVRPIKIERLLPGQSNGLFGDVFFFCFFF